MNSYIYEEDIKSYWRNHVSNESASRNFSKMFFENMKSIFYFSI